MAIRLDGPLLKVICRRKYGDAKIVEQLLCNWELLYGNAPSGATVHRWLTGALPQTADALWKLCGLLNVDPIAVLDHRSIDSKESDHLLSAYQRDAWARYKSFSYLKDFLGRHAAWPPKVYQQTYFPDRAWCIREFEHTSDSRTNYYQAVRVVAEGSDMHAFPIALHIAFKQRGRFADRWLEYGVISIEEDTAHSFHIDGGASSRIRIESDRLVYFETFFGPEAASFRVASLHLFELELAVECPPERKPLRFSG